MSSLNRDFRSGFTETFRKTDYQTKNLLLTQPKIFDFLSSVSIKEQGPVFDSSSYAPQIFQIIAKSSEDHFFNPINQHLKELATEIARHLLGRAEGAMEWNRLPDPQPLTEHLAKYGDKSDIARLDRLIQSIKEREINDRMTLAELRHITESRSALVKRLFPGPFAGLRASFWGLKNPSDPRDINE